MTAKEILITGGAGYIGSHMVQMLAERNSAAGETLAVARFYAHAQGSPLPVAWQS